MSRVKSFAALAGLGACAALAPAAAAAPISKTTMFEALAGRVACGIEIHPASAPAHDVLCAARGIPAPKGVGDPGFVQIAVTGAPRTLRLSQNSFAGGSSAKLGRGRLWNGLGVTCHVAASTVLCFNGDNHGFIIGDGHYRAF